ncbi:hypothetical protein D3C72_1996850 [compost metagenome]
MSERAHVGFDEVGHVDVVAHPGAIGRGVVRAVDIDLRPFAERRFAGDLEQVRCADRRLARPA